MTTFPAILFELKVQTRRRVAKLQQQKPELFEEINLKDYSPSGLLTDIDQDSLSEYGEADWFTVDEGEERGDVTYRFYWKQVFEHIK